jgi:peptidoglycan/xylan/chitin deacetylase (PgdA/CDA1 family)
MSELLEGKKELEEYIGKEITKFAYPKGWFNDRVKEWVKRAGFKEARTMKMGITDRTGYDDYELPVSAHIYPREEYNKDIVDGVIEKYKEAKSKAEKGYFNLVLHGWEVEKFQLWYQFEKILAYIYEDINSTKNKS